MKVDWEEYAQRIHLDDSLYNHDMMQRQRMEEIAKRCEGVVLDVGAGDGFLQHLLKLKGLESLGTEVSDTRIKNARDKYDVQVIRGDINELEIGDDQFETVAATEVLEHTKNPGQGLKEMCRIAKKKVIFTLPVGEFNDSTHQWKIDGVYIPKTGDDDKQGEGIILIEMEKK